MGDIVAANTNHPCFIQPTNTEIFVWRYMDFTKFVSLLETKSLFFCQADCFDDSFEGSLPKGNLINRNQIYSQIPENQREYAISQMTFHRKRMLSHTYINCWHMNEHESAAMWKLYAKTNEAVAICTKYSSLVQALDENVFVGLIHYIDYETSTIPENNSFWPFMFKRVSFSHEREVRAVVQNLAQDFGVSGGIIKSINPEELIEKVYVAPNAPNWYFNLVEQIVNRYGLSKKVIQSSLSEQPLY
jgi:hypothetical protein